MKRYWKVVTICLAALITIGTFYIQSSFAQGKSATFEFKKISGNENEIKNLIISGDVGYEDGRSQPLQIINEETINPNDQSFFQVFSYYYSPSVKKLIEDHRSFMRGKELMPSYFFEDEKFVVYANMIRKDIFEQPNRTFTLEVAILHKKSEKTSSIKLDITENEKYSWMDVQDVQIIGGELKIIILGTRIDGGEELNVYRLDMEQQKLLNKEAIISTPPANDGPLYISILADYDSIQPQKYLLLKLESAEFETDESISEMAQGGHENSRAANQFIIYNFKTNQSKKLIVPDEMVGTIELAELFDSTCYIQSQSKNDIVINQFEIENEKWGPKLTYDIPDTEGVPYIKLMNGKIYIIGSTSKGHFIHIGDLKTGKLLYEGELKLKNAKSDQKDYQLYINGVESVQ